MKRNQNLIYRAFMMVRSYENKEEVVLLALHHYSAVDSVYRDESSV